MVNPDITGIIKDQKLVAHFQPVVSVARQNICGLEGLIRGIGASNTDIIPPQELFEAAKSTGLQIELDRACRDTIMQAYSNAREFKDNALLFLNIQSSILDTVLGSNHLMNAVEQHKIKANNIVIEINESNVKNTALLKKFVEIYRSRGFLIALDDIGCGFSNMDRIPLIKPDIVKTSISIVKDICTNFYVQEVFRSIVSLSTKIGALVVAEGIETKEEAAQIMTLGANMIQGYYISKPAKINDIEPGLVNRRIRSITEHFQAVEKDKFIRTRNKFDTYSAIMGGIVIRLSLASPQNFDSELIRSIIEYEQIECAYILDENGIQCSSTVFSDSVSRIKKNQLFSPATIGFDHTPKVYYRYLNVMNTQQYITEPYTSLASGNLCQTFSKVFEAKENKKYIVCVDFKVDENQN